MNKIQNFALNLIGRYKTTSNGWMNYNCPQCISMGESRNDTKGRGGLQLTPEGGIKYKCFNCKFSASWRPTKYLSKEIIGYWKNQGATSEQIKEVRLEILRLNESTPSDGSEHKHTTKEYQQVSLPDGAISLEEAVKNYPNDENLIRVIQYIEKRHPKLLEWFPEVYWSPVTKKYGLSNYVIYPLKHFDNIYGWTARKAFDVPYKREPKWIGDNSLKYMLNTDKLYDKDRDIAILVEGTLDAIAIDAVGLLGTEISPQQLSVIKNSGKQIIVVPDRDSAGKNLVNIAIDNGWAVSLPPFDTSINDVFEAVSVYGRLMTVKLIRDYAESNPLKIKTHAIDWFLQ